MSRLSEPGTHDRSLQSGGIERQYLLHVPTNATEDSPLFVMLHGAGAEMRWTLEETRWNETADQHGFVLAIPQALPLDPTHPPTFRRNPTWWNDGSPVSKMARRNTDDVAFLTALLDKLGPRPVFITGFSNGAAMTFRMAIERGERLTAIAPLAGYCWQEVLSLSHPLPTFYLVGIDDPLVPLEGGTIQSPWGWVETRPSVRDTIERWRKVTGTALFEAHLVENLGHHWPGGPGRLSRRLFGPPRPDLPINDVIFQFFARFFRDTRKDSTSHLPRDYQ